MNMATCSAFSHTSNSEQVMGLLSKTNLLSVLSLLCCFCLNLTVAIDNIRSSQSINDTEYIISNGSAFRLGFFSPENSTNRYLGIWYNNISVFTVIWVANRQKPLKDSSGILTISKEGNLVVLNGQAEIFWSSNISNSVTNSSATLGDFGNLVLQVDTTGLVLWESFQHPSDSFLPKMKLSTNLRTDQRVQLTSWKSPSDPSIGSFSLGIDALNIPEVFVWKEGHPYWRSGPWNGQAFLGTPNWNPVYRTRFTVVDDKQGAVSDTFTDSDVLHLQSVVLGSQGNVVQTYWDDGKKDWEVVQLIPEDVCDVYGTCNAFGSCDSQSSQICSCLRGFEPKIIKEWNRGNWTSGCVRRTPLQCERMNNSIEEGKADGFFKLEMIKVPDFAEWSNVNKEDCRKQCLEKCSCVAYGYYTGIGCLSWSGNLIDLRQFSVGGSDIYIRLANLEFDERNLRAIITITVTIGAIAIASTAFFFCRWMAKKKRAMKSKSNESLLFDFLNDVKLQDLPIFNLEELATATNNFDMANKLGQGGFGPVYRGTLHNGQGIAVKRLSRASGQGLEEFMNEVALISKLQHRNLVRLLGCCIEGEEKMLIYEYMPNKSLDAILFDPVHQKLLNWRKRFNIIEGICRGLLYLHRDSRLKIIHRDLKASNILLDQELNPKISDFGMARIFGGNEDQVKTIRVVGTYGYMSPEYAMRGLFSEKSDVFSFGVLLLEIVSGRRNTCICDEEQYLGLVGLAWKLWNDDNSMALVEPAIWDPCFQMDILKCIHVGLLCVQELARDRPNASTVTSMLKSEILDLPTPKQPAFMERQIASNIELARLGQIRFSICNVTVSTVSGR
ncbi:G-type lectin S-receptor-like serine/threonine-protein kinase At1g11300 isoform X2 [Quercus robur]|uniref:G-type lectin S-receptor-like serine/threonine-protein kinase At1g11300 isoform X2 n=1 Tax=Quercus robur TaxID=38942 RepID=UPI0021621EDC|nr:G-type lectin S-receptor-like serine/threonine-protein kinase At1g11300 isoform X2 [Quercus robur]